MSNSVESVSQIQFYNHTFFLPENAGVDGFLNQNYVVQYLPPFDETALVFWNDCWKEFFNSIGYHLGNDFVTYVAERDWSEPVKGGGPFLFR